MDDARQIDRLIHSLSRSNPVRQIAESICEGKEIPADSVSTLAASLYGIRRMRWKEQALAAWCLGRIPLVLAGKTEATRALSWILAQRPARSMGCFVVSGCLFAYLGFIWIAYTSVMDGVVNRIRAAAAESLGLIGSPEAAQPLADALSEMSGKAASGDRHVRIAAARALPAVLRNMPDNGYGELPITVVLELCRLLGSREEEAVLAALECLMLMGTGAAIPAVERLAAGHKHPAIKESARRTLLALSERRVKERERETLLRATASPQSPERELLRPTMPAAQTDSESLLRPFQERAEGDLAQENRLSTTE